MPQDPLSIVFELARTDAPEDPYAFQFGPQTYTLRTEQGGRKSVQLDWNDEFLNDLGQLQGARCGPEVIQRVSHVLRGFLQPAGWSWMARDITEAVRASRPVRLTVRSAAAELYALPWELLPLEGSGQCIGELTDTLIRYEWPETTTVKPATGPARPGDRVLMAWSDAGGAVPSAEHIAAIESACKSPGVRPFDPSRDVLPAVSLDSLADELDRATREAQPVTVLHLLCHGGEAGQTMGLIFNSEDNRHRPETIDAWRLRQILAPHAATLRLVVLMACESARSGPFDSVAQAIHRTGFQAVVGSRFPLTVAGSIQVAEALYDTMASQRLPLESAFLAARARLARNASRLDSASLQLYAREADGHGHHFFSTQGRQPASSAQDVTHDPGNHPRASSHGELAMLGLAELLDHRKQLENELSSRFERELALVYTDIHGSTALFARLGHKAAHGLQQRYHELLEQAASGEAGRIFHDDGDGLHACFPTVKGAIRATFAFFEGLSRYNYEATRENQLKVRASIHYGPVLTDGELVAGAEVELSASVADMVDVTEIWLTQPAFRQASNVTRTMCQPLENLEVFDGRRTVEVYLLPWRTDRNAPALFVNEETGEATELPGFDTISFGRLDQLADGTAANDIVLDHPEASVRRSISRWHFELRRTAEGYILRQVSGQVTEVDGEEIGQNEEAPVRPGSVVRIANALTLRFGAARQDETRLASTVGTAPKR